MLRVANLRLEVQQYDLYITNRGEDLLAYPHKGVRNFCQRARRAIQLRSGSGTLICGTLGTCHPLVIVTPIYSLSVPQLSSEYITMPLCACIHGNASLVSTNPVVVPKLVPVG